MAAAVQREQLCDSSDRSRGPPHPPHSPGVMASTFTIRYYSFVHLGLKPAFSSSRKSMLCVDTEASTRVSCQDRDVRNEAEL